MTDEERNQILKMIADGKVTPEEGLKLMQTLEQNPPEDEKVAPQEPAAEASGPETAKNPERSGLEADPRIARVKSAAQRLWQVPLWIGVAVIILSALGMYGLIQGPGMNFWFYCLTLPLLLGVLLIVIAVGSRKARWLFVDVRQKADEKPHRIFLGFPLPLKFAAWVLRIVRKWFPSLARELDEEKDGPGMDGAIKIIELVETSFTSNEPLVVNVDEGDDGEKVQVYIG